MNLNYDILFNYDLNTAMFYLMNMRMINIQSEIEGIAQELRFFYKHPFVVKQPTFLKKVTKRTTINPILLSTALAISRIEKKDYNNYLDGFTENRTMADFDDILLKLETLKEHPDFLEILEIEKACVESLIDIGLFIMADKRIKKNDAGEPIIWDAYLCCWMAFNFEYVNGEFKNDEFSMLSWGNRFNDEIHKLREKYEFELNKINGLLNELLSGEYDSEKIDSCLKEKRKISLCIERFRKLYYWDPEEIYAYSAESMVSLHFQEWYKSDDDSSNKHRLTAEMLNKLHIYEQNIRNRH